MCLRTSAALCSGRTCSRAARSSSRCWAVRAAAGWFRQVRQLLAAVLPLFASRFLATGGETGVHGDPVQPGAEGAISSEVLDVSPGPDPGLLAGVLGVLGPQYAERHPVHEPGVFPDQMPERPGVSAGGPHGQLPSAT